MDELFYDSDVNPRIRSILQRKAHEMVGRAGITLDDVDDVVQDLLLHLLKRHLHIDPDRGTMVRLVCCVVDRKRSNMVASRRAIKRNQGEPPNSLSDAVDPHDSESPTREEVYDMDTYLRLTGKSDRGQEDRTSLEIDMRALLRALPPDLGRIALLLMYYPKSEAAQMLGIPWSTFCDRCRELRQKMIQMKLNEYVKTPGKSGRNPVPAK